MGMNRKWNMKVFELHDSDADTVTPISETEQNDDVFVDTKTSTISMKKYPFSVENAFGENVSQEDVLTINLSELTPDENLLENITNTNNWKFNQGNASNIIITDDNDTIFKFQSVVKAIYDIPTEATRWIFKFDLLSDRVNFRDFIYFDGTDDTETSVNYAYGIDVPSTGYPRLEHIINYNTFKAETIANTIADEQYFTGADYMSVILSRWDDTYTLYYDNRYMITIPTEQDSINRFGIWTWSGATTYIKNPTLYVIEDNSDAEYVFITNAENIEESEKTDQPATL